MTIIAFAPRATLLPVDPEPALQAIRAVVGQYWRRSALLAKAAAPLPALEVFDSALAEALFSVKLHLRHHHGLRPALLQAIEGSRGEVRRPEAAHFARVCIDVIELQLGRATDLPAEIGGAWLQQAPEAVLDALCFCLDESVGRYLAAGVPVAMQQPASPLSRLLLRLAIARPGVSDAFSRAVATAAAPLSGGLAALARVRTTDFVSHNGALDAPLEQGDDDATLVALALARSGGLADAVRHRVESAASRPVSIVTWAFAAACLPVAGVHRSLQDFAMSGGTASAGLHLLYLCALLGHPTLLRDAAHALDWGAEADCRAIRDAAGLLTGEFDDGLFDLRRAPEARQALLQDRLEAAVILHKGPVALRMGRRRETVVLEESAPPVGAPLRQWLYLEHAARTGSAVWLNAHDFAPVQALGITTASMLERWGHALQGNAAG